MLWCNECCGLALYKYKNQYCRSASPLQQKIRTRGHCRDYISNVAPWVPQGPTEAFTIFKSKCNLCFPLIPLQYVTQVKNALKVFSLALAVTLQSQPHERMASLALCPPPLQQLEVMLMKQNKLAEGERNGKRRKEEKNDWFLSSSLPPSLVNAWNVKHMLMWTDRRREGKCKEDDR